MGITLPPEHNKEYVGVHWILPGLKHEVRIEVVMRDENSTIAGSLIKKLIEGGE